MSEQLTASQVLQACARRAVMESEMTPDTITYPALIANANVAGVTPAQLDRATGLPAETLTNEQWEQRVVTAAAVALATSAGRPGNRAAGNRGLWGLSVTEWPAITDAMADDPAVSTQLVFVITARFSDWGRWAGNAGLNLGSTAHTQAASAVGAAREVLDNSRKLRNPIVAGTVMNWVSDLVPDWATGLARLIANLLSPQWWRRLGVGAFGLLLLVIAVILILAPEGTRRI